MGAETPSSNKPATKPPVTEDPQMNLRFTTASGNTIGYSDNGDSGSFGVVIGLSGLPGSRFMFHMFTYPAGTRVIGVDKPGFGISSYQRDRTVASFAREVLELADHLGVKKFTVMGVSGGGPYAYACAAIMPKERLERVVVAAGVAPRDLNLPEKSMLMKRIIWSLPFSLQAVIMKLMFRTLMSDHFPNGMKKQLPTPDRVCIEELAGWRERLFVQDMKETFRHGSAGVESDLRILAKYSRWGFEVEDCVNAPVIILHGAEDKNVPPSHSQWYADNIPGAKLEILKEQGHFSIIHDFARQVGGSI